MSAINPANPYTPPRAAVSDVYASPDAYSQPKVWAASGRIGRARYLAYLMVGYLALVAGGFGIGALITATGSPLIGGAIMFLVMIPYLVLSVLCAIQRAHDMDWSGWSVFLMLIPLVAFVWVFKAGSPGANRFGAPPPPNGRGVIVGAWLIAVVPLLGILAAVALPAYQQYTQRAQALQSDSAPAPSAQQ